MSGTGINKWRLGVLSGAMVVPVCGAVVVEGDSRPGGFWNSIRCFLRGTIW